MHDNQDARNQFDVGHTREMDLESEATHPSAPTVRTGPQRQPTSFSPGETVADRFRIVRFIGRGGMGEVYEARDVELDARIAIKTVLADHASSGHVVERFKREIQLSRQVTHRNVCRIFDLFRHQPASDQEPAEAVLFLTMEFIEGETLAHRIKRAGAIPPEQARHLLRQMAAALDAAHEAGIVHRDFKSSNVMLLPGPEGELVKVTDFGLARSLTPGTSDDSGLTGSGNIVGTPAYMAPEQVRGKAVSPATDIYALGVVLFEMLTGTRPFAGDTPLSTVSKHLEEAPPSPRSILPSLGDAWERAILRCLEKNPERRFSSAGEVAAAIAGDGPRRRLKLRLPTRWLLAAAAATLVAAAALVALVAVLLLRSPPGHENEPQSPPDRLDVRRAVAVLGFRNLSQRAEDDWLSTALGEMLMTELGVGEDLRTVTQESIAQLRLNRPGTDPAELTPGPDLYRDLLADVIVTGAFAALGDGTEAGLRIDLRVHELARGPTPSVITETGAVGQLFVLVGRLGQRLRDHLGARSLTAAEEASARGLFPSEVAAARSYAEGLASLRAFNAVAARDQLERTLEVMPDFAPGHAALAKAWLALGHDREASAAAGRAFELREGVPRQERLQIEALRCTTRWDHAGALAIRQTLFTFYPDNLEYGLGLTDAQLAAGQSAATLETVAELRRLPPPAGQDPRIDLAEAEALEALGRHEAAVTAAEKAAAAGEARGTPLLAAGAMLAQARSLERLGEHHRAEELLGEAEARFRLAGDARGVGQVLIVLGRIQLSMGRTAEALESFNASLARYRAAGDRRGEARTLGNLGVVYRRTGRSEEAQQALEQSITTCQETGDLPCQGRGLESLGTFYYFQGEPASSRRCYEQAVEIFAATGDAGEHAQVLSNLGIVENMVGNAEAARKRYEQALQVLGSASPKRRSMILNNLGNVLLGQGDLPAARARWNEALELKLASDDHSGAAIVRANLAGLLIREGQLEPALQQIEAAVSTFREIGDQPLLIEGLLLLGKARCIAGDLEQAADHLEEAQTLCRESGQQPCLDRARHALARVRFAQSRLDGLVTTLRSCAENQHSNNDPEEEAAARSTLIRVLLAEGRTQEAEIELQWARAAATDSGKSQALQEVAITAAMVAAAAGDTAAAVTALLEVIREAAAAGSVDMSLEARLALAEIDHSSAKGPYSTPDALRDLADEAERRGFGLIAARARALGRPLATNHEAAAAPGERRVAATRSAARS